MTTTTERVSAIVTNSYGKGNVVFVGFNLLDRYYWTDSYELLGIMQRILLFTDKEPNAYLESGKGRIEVVPAMKDKIKLVNIINTTEHRYDKFVHAPGAIPELYDLTVAVKCDAEPQKVMLEPEYVEAEYTYDGKYAHVKINKLHIHRIITVE